MQLVQKDSKSIKVFVRLFCYLVGFLYTNVTNCEKIYVKLHNLFEPEGRE